MSARFGSLLDHKRHARWSVFECRGRAVPGKRPTPIQTDLVMWIDDVLSPKLMSKNLGAVLSDRDGEVFISLRPVSIANPKRVLAGTWNFEILIQRRPILIGARGRGTPFTLAPLRPVR